jgi:flavin-dependent dehydrogenase
MPTQHFDAIVVGGGPGGSTTAAYLARAGLRVLIIEGKRFPRWHIGESLLAASINIFDEVGVLPSLERFQRKLGALWVWGPALSLIRLEMPSPGYAYQVQREQFDLILLENAQASGAQVWPEQWARDPIWDERGRMVGLHVQAAGGDSNSVYARFIVDASGLFQYLPKRLGLPMDQFGPQRAAVTAYWAGAARPSYPYSADVISEACADGWLWFIPFVDGRVGVGFVGDAADMEQAPDQLLTEQIQSSQMIRRLLRKAEPTHRPRLLRYTNHTVSAPLWNQGYLLVGDTAAFVDPLFSTGINATVYSASLAAAAIASVVAGDLPEGEAAEWYDARVRSHYRRTTEMTRLLYATHPGTSPFWQARCLDDLSSARAEEMLRDIGSDSLRLFTLGMADGALSLPGEVRKRLPEFCASLSPTRLPEGCLLSFAPEVQPHATWMRQGARLVPAIRVGHARRRTHEIDLYAGGAGHRFLSMIDGERSLGTIADSCAQDPRQRVKLSLLAGAMAAGGILSARSPAPRTTPLAPVR